MLDYFFTQVLNEITFKFLTYLPKKNNKIIKSNSCSCPIYPSITLQIINYIFGVAEHSERASIVVLPSRNFPVNWEIYSEQQGAQPRDVSLPRQ